MNKKKLAWQLPFLAILIIGTIIILKKQAPFRTDEGFVFGTVYKITYQSEDNLKEEIETELKKVDNSLSPFNPNSVITRVNHNEKTEVDSFFVHVFHLSKKISDETHGAFDITVAPLVNAWGFGFKKSTGVDSLIVDSLRQMIGYQKIDLQNHRITKKDPRIMLDCSAIAKGFGVDAVARLLERKGIKNYMVDIGGEVVVRLSLIHI